MSMSVDRYLKHIPAIEKRLRDLKPDAVVFGMGPTGHLLSWIDQSLLRGVRLFTAHDGCRIRPAHDLILMDPPSRALHPDTTRYQEILKSRPERIWVFPRAWKDKWDKHLSDAVRPLVSVQEWGEWNPHTPPFQMKPKLEREKDGKPFPDTFAISPTGCTTLAWALGCRRIGVIGVDILDEHGHSSLPSRPSSDVFFASIAKQADAAGGCIRNLSPISTLKLFEAAWTHSASSSAPTPGSETPEPKPSSNTASGNTPLVGSSSFGCEPVIPATKSANTG